MIWAGQRAETEEDLIAAAERVAATELYLSPEELAMITQLDKAEGAEM